MEASVQYNDFTGTAAADISDYYLNSMNEYLKRRYPSFDWERYYCVGCEFYASYGQYPSVFFICQDANDSNHHLLRPEKDFSLEEFFELFKRFSIVIGRNNIGEVEIDEAEDPIILKSEDE